MRPTLRCTLAIRTLVNRALVNRALVNCALAVLAAAPAVPCQDQAGAAPPRRPNIVFLLTDDQSFDSMGCYGNPDVQTPQMDRLARDGMVFDNHYVTTAICMASRASIMTGMFEFKTGCNFEHGSLVREHWSRSYPVLLRKAGYLTGMAGKIGFTVSDAPDGKGVLPRDDFDHWGAGPGQTHYETARNPSIARYAAEFPHSTRAYGAFGRDFIAAAAKAGKPFCLSISFKAPHRPTTPDKEYDAVYRGKTFRKPKNFGRDKGAHLSAQSRQGRQYRRFESWGYATRFDEVMAVYHQQVYAIDVALGMIRKALQDHRVADNTVIVFTSDNGFLCGAHGYGSKVLPYAEASRVPLIVYDPRHPNSGRRLRTRALTGNVDFAPTILRLAGLEPPAQMDGRDLRAVYDDPKAAVREVLPLVNVWGPRQTHSLAVVTRDAKYVYWPYAGPGFEATEELFDLGADPYELANRIASAGELRDAMRGAYDAMVRLWKQQAVSFHGYRRFGTIFDRAVPWSEKERLAR